MAGNTLVEVTATYTTAEDLPADGVVRFAPVLSAVDGTPDPRIVTQSQVLGVLDAGVLSVSVIASDDPGWRTDGPVAYQIREQVDGRWTMWTAYILGPGPVDLSSIVPVTDAPDVGTMPIPGPPGRDGVDGVDGATGPQGPPGPTGATGPTSTQTTHPNGDDVLVQAWDAGKSRWQVVHYDSGWRDISALITNGWVPIYGTVRIRRINSTLMWAGHINGAAYTSDHITATAMPGFMSDGLGTVTTHNVAPWANYIACTGTTYYIGGAAHTVYALTIVMPTSDPIPTSLPGTLSAPAPYLGAPGVPDAF